MRYFVFLFVMVLPVFFFGGVSYALTLESDAFKDGERIPDRYTGVGEDISPALKWSDIPSGTKSFVLIMEDPDASGGVWVHWVMYEIPEDFLSLDENVPKETFITQAIRQGVNGFRKVGYKGPYPPPGATHRYVFKLYALNVIPDIPPAATKDAVMEKMKGRVIEETTLTGLYSR